MITNKPSLNSYNVLWADFLKILAIVGVISMHAGSVLFSKSITDQRWEWLCGVFYCSLGAFSVPVFLMLSGAFLLNSRDDLSTFFGKRIMKVAFPFFFWVIIYAFFVKYYLKIPIEIPRWVAEGFISGPVFYHFWYVYLILGLYLVIPILRTWIRHATKSEIHYFLLLWIITVSVLPIFDTYLGFKLGIHLSYIHGHIGYLVLGYYLKEKSVSKKTALICLILFIVSVAASTWLTYTHSLSTGTTSQFYFEKMSISTLISSVSIFLLIKNFSSLPVFTFPKIQSIVKQTGDLSFGVYLVHAIILIWVMDGALGFKITVDQINPLFAVPMVVIATYCISALLIFIIKRIKFLRFIAP